MKSIEFKGHANGLFYAYFIEKYKYHVAAFNEDMKGVSKLKVEEPETIKNCKIHDGIIFNDKFYQVLTGKSSDTEKDKQGIFLWEYNGETGSGNHCLTMSQYFSEGSLPQQFRVTDFVISNNQKIKLL